MFKKMVAGLIIIVICTQNYLGIAQGNVNLAQNSSYEHLQKQLKKVKGKMKAIEGVQSKNTQKMMALQSELEQSEQQSDRIAQEIEAIEAVSANSFERIRQIEDKMAQREVILRKRLRAMYKLSPASVLDLLIASENVQQAYERFEMLFFVCQSDQELLKSMRTQRDLIQNEKNSIDRQKFEKLQLTNALREAETKSSQTIVALFSEQKKLKSDYNALEEQEDLLLQASQDIEEMLKGYASDVVNSNASFVWPAPKSKRITSPFGVRIHPIYKKKKMHTGIDIDLPYGEAVVASADGKIILSEWYGGYGKTVMIDHGGGVVTLYAHNANLAVQKGEIVKKGQKVASCGSTGVSTGAHLHFEVRQNGKPQNPMDWFQSN